MDGGMLSVALLLLQVATAIIMGSLHGPAVHASLNAGNAIMTASNTEGNGLFGYITERFRLP